MENGIYRVLYRNRTVVLPLLSLSFFFFSFCLEFWVRGNGSRADRSVSLERRERRGNRGSCCGTLREREREEETMTMSQLSAEKDRNKDERRKKEEEVVGGRLKKQLFSMRPYHGEFRRRRGNMLGGQQQ